MGAGVRVGTAEFEEDDTSDGASDAKMETVDTSAPVQAAPKPVVPKPAAPGAMYTMLAREGVNAAQLLNAALAKYTLGKTIPRRVEVAAPMGQSTDGGKKARQSVTLVAIEGAGPVVMCGWIDAAQKVAELRDYASVAEQYKSRFGSKLEFGPDEYAAMIKDLEKLLRPLGFQIAEEEEEEEDDESIRPGARRGAGAGAGAGAARTIAWVLAAVVVGGAIAFALT